MRNSNSPPPYGQPPPLDTQPPGPPPGPPPGGMRQPQMPMTGMQGLGQGLRALFDQRQRPEQPVEPARAQMAQMSPSPAMQGNMEGLGGLLRKAYDKSGFGQQNPIEKTQPPQMQGPPQMGDKQRMIADKLRNWRGGM